VNRGLSPYVSRLFVALIGAAVGLALAGMFLNLTAKPVTAPVLSTETLKFDGAMALERTRLFVETFPNRTAGSPTKAQAAQWLVGQLVSLGYDPQIQSFQARVRGVFYPDMANVWAMRRGSTSETVVIYGHYDVPRFVEQGAADDGSAVGTLLELAKVFAAEQPRRTIVFLFTDCGEYGMAGADAFASSPPYPSPVTAGVGLDFLNIGEPAGVSVECIGTLKGYTPLWLRSLAVAAATAEAGKAFSVDTIAEWVERSVALSPTDSGMFLRHGVPAVNLAGVPVDTALERAVYHTSQDTMGNLTAGSFDQWGRTAERVLRSLDSLEAIPSGQANSMVYLGLPGGDRYVPGWAVRLIQFFVFMPLWAVVAAGWFARRRSLTAALSILLGEARRIGVAAGCLGAGWVALKLQALVGLVARYPLYPATAKDAALYHPAIVPVLSFLVFAGGAVYAVRRFTFWLDPPLAADWAERYHALTSLLALLVFLVWLEGAGFAAVLFLAPAALVWVLQAEPQGRAAWAWKAVGGVLVAVGTVPFFAFLVVFGQVYLSGPAWWYLMLGSTFGIIGLKATFVFAIAAALHWEAFACATGLGAGHFVPSAPSAGVSLDY